MPDRFDSWESYFYPETIDWTGQGTLRNKFDERDADVLHVKEYARAAVRQRELMAGTARHCENVRRGSCAGDSPAPVPRRVRVGGGVPHGEHVEGSGTWVR